MTRWRKISYRWPDVLRILLTLVFAVAGGRAVFGQAVPAKDQAARNQSARVPSPEEQSTRDESAKVRPTKGQTVNASHSFGQENLGPGAA